MNDLSEAEEIEYNQLIAEGYSPASAKAGIYKRRTRDYGGARKGEQTAVEQKTASTISHPVQKKKTWKEKIFGTKKNYVTERVSKKKEHKDDKEFVVSLEKGVRQTKGKVESRSVVRAKNREKIKQYTKPIVKAVKSVQEWKEKHIVPYKGSERPKSMLFGESTFFGGGSSKKEKRTSSSSGGGSLFFGDMWGKSEPKKRKKTRKSKNKNGSKKTKKNGKTIVININK